jgi:hypothetical protein
MAKKTASPGAADPLFTRQDYETLRRERRRLNDLIEMCDRAEACGIDVGIYRTMRSEIDGQLSAIETHFMSPPPV